MGRVVLVTGVSRYVGGAFARLLSARADQFGVDRVIGVDVVPPPHDIGSAQFVRADIRGPMISRIMAQSRVDTLVHLGVIATPIAAGGRVSQKEINVMGSMQLLAAAQRCEGLRRLVVKSSAAVYGSSSRDPAMFTEDSAPAVSPKSGFGKDSVEVEGYVRSLSRRRPDIDIATLRMASVVGPGIRTAITDYFTLPLVPAPLGYAARLQFLHEDDALMALLSATTREDPRPVGTVNVSGDGVLTVQQAAAIAGRPVVPVLLPLSGPIGRLVRTTGLVDFSADQMEHLAYGRGMDTSRMRKVLGFSPIYTSREAFADFVAHQVRGAATKGLVSSAIGVVDSAAGAAAHALTGALQGSGIGR
jgi:UDP-glucose 4-epimerase